MKELEEEIARLQCENAYLRGEIIAYEKFLKMKGYIHETEDSF